MIAVNRPLRIAEVLDLPLQLIRRHFRQLLPVAMIGSLAATIPTMIPQLMLIRRNALTNQEYLLVVQIMQFAMLALSILLTTLAMLATVHAIRGVLEENPIGVAEAYRRAIAPSAAYLTLLVALMLVLVGCCLCCLPGVIISIYISLLAPLLVYEPPRGINAIGRAMRLAHFNPGPELATRPIIRIALLGLIAMLVSYAATALITLPVSAAGGYFTFRKALEGEIVSGMSWSLNITNLIATLFNGLVQSFPRLYAALGMTLIFLNTRNLREGKHLESSLETRIEQAQRDT